ncbi:m7GpppX diphosphatase [Nematocida homosporus]|uniref:m7GpppX diphosphatase n=1 Tax=Nematocida homosporus TaxID=1912981 RepID=UPI00221F91EA|nr:m7GpppX diphosphatase [Nematocida homosporus]KAI5184723.1 m7GpppX diphosphatase [Nematocida homosporus]
MSKLSSFKALSLLSSRAETISKIYLGEIDNQQAILLLNKTPFLDSVPEALEETASNTNDIYSYGTVSINDTVKYTIIHPATPALIKKYTESDHVIVKESYAHYKEAVLPLALSKGPSSLWIENLFTEAAGKKAPYLTSMNEHLLYIDPDFLICPDLKWDRVNLDSLYLVVLFKDASLYTIRELQAQHIPLLKRVIKAVEKVLSTYGLDLNQIKMYFHYYPTFYRLHIHASALKTLWKGTTIGSAIMLQDVIQNLTICSDYYKRVELEISISTASYLYPVYQPEHSK